ncbi:MAG: DUF222 domain-containing protein [Gammaproteobacteria bacterium]|nr:DUF222 domain-containing protein [Gammaproteobacteria bacterium]
MDLHRTASSAPVRDAEHHSYNTSDPLPGSDAWMAKRRREEAALEDLETQITELWGHINAATAQFLALLAEFDRREGWGQHGVSSCAHWLSWQCGISPGAAREKVRVARTLESLPKIREAFGEGRLSYSKVRALTRGATAETEDTLLGIALNGTAVHVERTVRGFMRVQREKERSEAEVVHERCYLECRRQGDGSVKLEACLAPEVGEMLYKALEAAHGELNERNGDAEDIDDTGPAGAANPAVPADADAASADVPAGTYATQHSQQRGGSSADGSAGTPQARFAPPPLWDSADRGVPAGTPPRSVSQKRADALGHILGGYLAGKCSGSANNAHEVVVHIAHDALCNVPESSGAEFDNGHAVAVETARRLGCDGALVGVVEGAKGEPLAVGRRTRAVPPAIRRALRVRDGGCRFPGCGRSRYVHAHHIKHWADGGETRLDNLVTLCSEHHRLVHEGGYGIRMNEGGIEFLRPDGRVMPPAGMPHGERSRGNVCAASGAKRLAESNAARGINIDAQTARCKWGGERMDYNIAIDGLCWQAGYT